MFKKYAHAMLQMTFSYTFSSNVVLHDGSTDHVRWRHQAVIRGQWVNTLRKKKNGRHFADDILKCILLNENAWISIEIGSKGTINYIRALVQMMAWRRPGEMPLSEPMMVSL